MQKRFVSCALACAAMCLFFSPNTQAATLEYSVYTDLAEFTQAAGPTTLYDFESIAVNTGCKNYNFGDFTTYGPSLYNVNIENENTHELHLNTSSYTQDLALTFNKPIVAFGFDWRNTDNNDDMLRVDFDGTRYVLGAKDESGFWGVVLTKGVIDQNTPLLFGDTPGGAGWTEGNLDNFRYTDNTPPAPALPEPTTLSLAALAALAALHKRRRSA